MNDLIKKCDSYLMPAGRILLGAYFLIAGVQKLTAIENTAAFISTTGLPMSTSLAWIAGIFLVIVGASTVAGYKTKYATLLLAAYVIFVTLLFHGPQNWPAEQMAFLKNMGLLGGIIFIAGSAKSKTSIQENVMNFN